MRYSVKPARFCALFGALMLVASCSQLLAPNVQTELSELREGAYQLDPKHTAVLFKITHLGLSKFVGRFEKVEASLDFDAEHIENAKLHALVETASININNDKFANTLRGPGWLNTEVYPQASFESTSARRVDGNKVLFTGDLTFLGVTREVQVHITFNGGARNKLNGRYTIGFEAHSEFKRSDFGLDKYLALVGDDIELEVHAEFH